MCGRFTQHWDWEQLVGIDGVFEALDHPHDVFVRRYNIAPSQHAWVVRAGNAAERRATIERVRWGFPNPHRPGEAINARIETADRIAMFRDAARVRRCLIPADAFYEWQALGDGTKQPWALAPVSGVFLLAGLWSAFPKGDGFVTLTTDTPGGFAPRIHHRMPCVVRACDAGAWLDPGRGDGLSLARPFGDPAAFETRAWPVSGRVNSPKHDDARLLEPVTPDAGLFG